MPPSVKSLRDRYPWDLFPDNEEDVKNRFLPAFRQLGDVQEEVWGDCKFIFDGQETTKRLRLDAVVQLHKSVDEYESCIGVEFKGNRMRTAEMGTYMRQAVDYRQTNWRNYGYLPIVTCPGLTQLFCQTIDSFGDHSRSRCLTEAHGESLAFTLRRYVAAFGIGEAFFVRPLPVQYDSKYLQISFADGIWLRDNQRVNYDRKEFGRNQGSK
jgi:hypothetical protein